MLFFVLGLIYLQGGPPAFIHPRAPGNTLSFLSNHIYAQSKDIEGRVDMARGVEAHEG